MRRFNTQAELDAINEHIVRKSPKRYYISNLKDPYKSPWVSRRCNNRASLLTLAKCKVFTLFYSLKHPGKGIKVEHLQC